jgi:hypothetical protein
MRYKSVVEGWWGGSVKHGENGPKVPEMGRQERRRDGGTRGVGA